jgi:photosystem II stability/assembly factor-like uncharacterized protein
MTHHAKTAICIVAELCLLLAVAGTAHADLIVWSQQGLSGYTVTAVVIDPARPDTVYAATEEGGVFKSTDGGATWLPVNEGIGVNDRDIASLAIDPHQTSTLYAGTRAGAGIFKSTDGGAHWTLLRRPGFALKEVSALVTVATDPVTLYAAEFSSINHSTSSSVLKSTDGGATWNRSDLGLTDAAFVNDLAIGSGKLIVGTYDGLFGTAFNRSHV